MVSEFQGRSRVLLPRAAQAVVRDALQRSRVVLLIGPRQCGKTTLARQFASPESANYFDLEDPLSLRRLDEPMTALRPLRGLVVLDEVQRRPDLFPVLRVLADRDPEVARFLVLGSAGPTLLRQGSESLAGRIEVVELTGFQVSEVGEEAMDRLWLRGGLPWSFLARDDRESLIWRRDYIRALAERDLPGFGARLAPPALLRLLHMVAHYHGQIVNVAALSASTGISQPTLRRYLDLLEHLFLVRRLLPWRENLAKRQVKRPRLYFRDSGLLHQLSGAGTMDQLLTSPRLGASWEGFMLEKVLAETAPDQACFWSTHGGAEVDLLLFREGRRVGVEIKRADAPRWTLSMRIALSDLALDSLFVVYPGPLSYPLGDRSFAVPATSCFADFFAD